MAARFIDTEIWNEDWFCELGSEYQNFWTYITCQCNNAGIWKPNKIDFEIKSRNKINMVAFLEKVNERGCKERIFITENGRWFLTGFITFQWFNKKESFDLVLSNKLHKHIWELLKKDGISIKKVRGLREVLVEVLKTSKDKDKGKDSIEQEVLVKREKGEFKNENEDLNELEIGKTIEFIKITAQKNLNENLVKDYWKAFCLNNSQEFYASRNDKVSHFRNWLKMQKITVEARKFVN